MSYTQTSATPPLTGWAKAAMARQRTLLHRVAAGCASAVVFTPIIGAPTALYWLAAYMVMVLLERVVVRPERGIDGKAPAGITRFLCDAVLFTSASLFAWIVVPLWFQAGIFGGVAATIFLSAGMLQSVINGAGSMRITLLTVTPTAVAGFATPWLMQQHGAPSDAVIATATAVLVFLGICLSTARRLNDADRQQHAAYLLANTKRAEAERAMESRTAFLSMIAHDLRTPITAILTGADSLRGDCPPSEYGKLTMMQDAGQMMNALLNDLLDQSRIDAGRMTINAQPLDLRRVLAHTVRLWSAPIKAKGLKLVIDVDRSLPKSVLGDEMRLRQVLNNLFSNALKFTSSGTITLRASAWLDDRGDAAITIDVADTGLGMKPEQVSRLFTRFDQTADDIASRFGGSGLGLSISHDLARLMDGRLTARSVEGTGTTLTLALTLTPAAAAPSAAPALVASDVLASSMFSQLATPAAVVQSQPQAIPQTEAAAFAHSRASAVVPQRPAETDAGEASSDEAPLRVLVVDDHEINRRAIQLILQPFECDLTMACDGMSALELTSTTAFDVIFMDVRMPELDGRETTRRIRAAGGPNLHTPVIAVTADNSAEDQNACLGAGMNGFVAKPLTPSALIEALQNTLEVYAQRQAA